MNYYRRYVGDYLRATSKLSMLEHGAYTLLLDYYYAEEEPHSLDREEVYRMVRAMKPAEREAVDKVLATYFTAEPDGFHNERSDEELGKATPLIEASKINGKLGGRPKKNNLEGNPPGSKEKEPIKKPVDEPVEEPVNNHPPTTNHQPPAATHQPPRKDDGPLLARFEETWKTYPKRAGNNPKQDALKAWKARIGEGVNPDDMAAGTGRYAAFCHATSKVGTETVMQAVRFFGRSRCYEQDFDLPRPGPASSNAGNPRGPAAQSIFPDETKERTFDATATHVD